MKFDFFVIFLFVILVLCVIVFLFFDFSVCGYNRNGRFGNKIKLGLEINIVRSEGRVEVFLVVLVGFRNFRKKSVLGFFDLFNFL